ncbi:MFS family permease [Kitasatospora sp. MAA4]|uniref:MFS transporter n=1 Tax=Kitasatospora sp. MAA4 TaxID=3035093 RepID=UPI002473ED1A|nr:MFS transporter [Kitasatospora sp. MAA4]MDH6136433.1 MFS family permease [Kitasatospora sp. MAA4]
MTTTTDAVSTAPSDLPPTTPSSPRASRLLPRDPVLRLLTWTTLVNCLGNGLFLTVSTLYFTRILGYGVGTVGVVLTVAGLCGVLAGIPAGRAADRWGSKPVLILLIALEALGTVGYVLVDGFAAFAVLTCLLAAVDRGAAAVRNALYAEVLPADQRVTGRGYLRAVTNVAMGAGSVLAALTLQADSRPAYTATILADALSYALVALLLLRLPGTEHAPAARETAGAEPESPRDRRNPALRNLPFLVVTGLNSLLTLQFAMLEIGVPLWVVKDTTAPRALVAATLLVNTVLVVFLQVRATRGTEQPGAAARACARGGLLLAASCAVLGLAHGLPAVLASVVLLAGVALQAGGEVLSQAGGWALSYDLAGEGAHGSYQGVFSTGASVALMIGPALITLAVVGHGLAGWLLLGALFAASGAVMRPAVRWATAATA